MDLKRLAEANVLQEKIKELTRVLDAVQGQTTKFDIWVNSESGDEFSINHLIPMDLKTQIIQAAKSELELELKRAEKKFADL